MAACSFILAIAVQRNIFPLYSGDNDEPVYIWQAQNMLDGRATVPASEQEQFFRPWLTGRAGDRLVPAFTPGWPAALAAGELVFSTMLVSVGLAAAGATIACYGFAREVFGEQRRALIASAIFALSPFFVMLSGTYLNYVYGLALELTFGWLLLRGTRLGGRPTLAAAGAVWGLAFMSRPYDALLFAVPVGLYVVVRLRRHVATLLRRLAWSALGAAPLVAITLTYNAVVSGGPLTFPTTTQSGGRAEFFFGPRGIATDLPLEEYSLRDAVRALVRNLQPTPTWLLGGVATLAAVGYGVVRLRRTRTLELWLMIGLVVVFPFGYLFWWASRLTAKTALNGLGPHYYLPMYAALALLAAHGAVELWKRNRSLAVVGGLVGLVLTVVAVLPKLEFHADFTEDKLRYHSAVQRILDDQGGERSLVILEHRDPPYVLEPWGYLANKPDLSGPVLYAVDRGPDTVDLLERYPERRALRLLQRYRPGQPLEDLALIAKPESVQRGQSVEMRVRITNPSDAPVVIAYVGAGSSAEELVLDRRSVRGRSYEITWTVSADGIAYSGPAADSTRRLQELPREGELRVGAAFAADGDEEDPARSERRFSFRVPDEGGPEVEVLTADAEWLRFAAPVSAWLPVEVGDSLEVRASGIRSS